MQAPPPAPVAQAAAPEAQAEADKGPALHGLLTDVGINLARLLGLALFLAWALCCEFSAGHAFSIWCPSGVRSPAWAGNGASSPARHVCTFLPLAHRTRACIVRGR